MVANIWLEFASASVVKTKISFRQQQRHLYHAMSLQWIELTARERLTAREWLQWATKVFLSERQVSIRRFVRFSWTTVAVLELCLL